MTTSVEREPNAIEIHGDSRSSAPPPVRSFWRARSLVDVVGAETLLTLALCGPPLVVHALSFMPFFSDDGLISLRYAQRFLDRNGLTWTDGQRVEGYSNLLWILGVSLIGLFKVDLILAARILGIVCSLVAIALCASAVRERGARGAWPAIVGAMTLSLSSSMAVWSIGGLEQPLLAALVAWGAVSSLDLLERDSPGRRQVLMSATPLALLTLTRPDGVLFSSMLVPLFLLRWRSKPHRDVVMKSVLIVGAVIASHHTFRWLYYRDLWPNTAYAKVAFTRERLIDGLRYVMGFFRASTPLLVLWGASAGLSLTSGRYRKRFVILAVPGVVWLTYVAFMGGDIFPARRHAVAAIVLIALMIVDGLASLEDRHRRLSRVAWVAAAILLPWMGLRGLRDREAQRARDERWEWDGRPLGALLHRHLASTAPTIAVDAAGSLPYFSGLPAIDMLGLNDRFLARQKPSNFGRGYIGHELGDGAYVLSTQPDLVFFNLPQGEDKPKFLSGRQMVGDRRFGAEYRKIELEAADAHGFVRARLFARVASPKLGVERNERRVAIPGFLLATVPGSVANEDKLGRLGAVLAGPTPIPVDLGKLAPGRWTIRIEASGAPTRIVSGGVVSSDDRREITLDIERTQNVQISLILAPAAMTHVRRVIAERAD